MKRVGVVTTPIGAFSSLISLLRAKTRLELKIQNTCRQSPCRYPPRSALWSMLKECVARQGLDALSALGGSQEKVSAERLGERPSYVCGPADGLSFRSWSFAFRQPGTQHKSGGKIG
jgi:hypothetical protein